MEVLIGYRFYPHDCELICDYLRKKVSGELVNLQAVVDVDVTDVYEFEPRRLFDIHALNIHTSHDGKTMDLYAFVRRRKMCENGTRSVGSCGCWKATGGNVRILDKQGSVIGFKRTLSYTVKGDLKVNQEMMNWVMHEYTLPAEGNQLAEWSLCRIRKHLSGKALQ